MWGKMSLVLIGFMIVIAISDGHSVSTPSILVAQNVVIQNKFGSVTASKNMVMSSMTVYANGTINFNVQNFELFQNIYTFFLFSYGNGTFDLRFTGIIPAIVQVPGATSQSYRTDIKAEQIQYTTLQDPSIMVIYGSFVTTESQKVLFVDDFLYTNPLAESSWTIDRYTTSVNTGISTSSGYLIMQAQSSSSISTVHVTSPMYQPSAYTNGTVVKRKMTVALIPFAKAESPFTSYIRAGMDGLLTTGSYPGTGPYGTPFMDFNSNCVSNGGTNDAIGADYIDMNNAGGITVRTCGDGASNAVGLETGLNPTLYTVFTIETYGVFCSTCTDNAYTGSQWVYFRAYQRDSTGKIVAGTDQNINFTSNIAPLYKTSYAFISQFNNNNAATAQVSKIDLVQVQNYGSPVCLNVPGGTLCTSLPPVPNNLGSGVIGDIAWLANQIGFGDEQVGAIIMFLVLSMGFSFIPFILTRNYLVGGTGLLVVFSFFVYAGFLPSWMIFLPILIGSVLMVMIVNRFLGSHSLMGGMGDS